MKLSQVLLVEDNAGDALLVGQAHAGCPTGVRLHIARDGEQALQILEEPDFKALYPPKKNQTPVVVFTASENETDVSRAFALGAKEFVHKPHGTR